MIVEFKKACAGLTHNLFDSFYFAYFNYFIPNVYIQAGQIKWDGVSIIFTQCYSSSKPYGILLVEKVQ